MPWLSGLLSKILPVVLNWVTGILFRLFKKHQANKELEEKQDSRGAQAALVEKLRQEFLAALAANDRLPEEIEAMRSRLREESLRLINM